MEPFQIINRNISTSRDQIYMVRHEKYSSDRDSYLLQQVFLDLESAVEYQMQLWDSELKMFDQFTNWSGVAIPAGKTADDYVYNYDPRDDPNNILSLGDYIGWSTEAIVNAGIMSEDDFSEMNWDSDYGLTMGYGIVALKWNANKNRYG